MHLILFNHLTMIWLYNLVGHGLLCMLHVCYFDYLKLVIEFIFKVEVIFLQNSSSHISRKIFSISQTLKFPKLPFFRLTNIKFSLFALELMQT